MTLAQEKALLSRVLELTTRLTHVEAMLESAAKSEFERVQLLRDLRASAEHVRRLVYQKQALMEMVGRFVLERQENLTSEDMANIANINRMRQEMGGYAKSI